jgi:hypothetical protein
MMLPFRRRTEEIDCEIDLEQTPESFHAYAVPDGVDIRAGDAVLLHDAPLGIGFGEHMLGRRRATLFRATLVERLWTEFAGMFALTDLYEVGFEPKER